MEGESNAVCAVVFPPTCSERPDFSATMFMCLSQLISQPLGLAYGFNVSLLICLITLWEFKLDRRTFLKIAAVAQF